MLRALLSDSGSRWSRAVRNDLHALHTAMELAPGDHPRLDPLQWEERARSVAWRKHTLLVQRPETTWKSPAPPSRINMLDPRAPCLLDGAQVCLQCDVASAPTFPSWKALQQHLRITHKFRSPFGAFVSILPSKRAQCQFCTHTYHSRSRAISHIASESAQCRQAAIASPAFASNGLSY